MSPGFQARALQLSVSSQAFDVPCVHKQSGSIWWTFVEESGEPAYRGIEIEPAESSLPEVLTLEGHDLVLEPVPKWDKTTRTHLDETLPFERTRKFHGTQPIDGVTLSLQIRITVKKNKKWNLSFRAWGAEGPIQPEGSGGAAPGGSPPSEGLSELLDLLEEKPSE